MNNLLILESLEGFYRISDQGTSKTLKEDLQVMTGSATTKQ